MKTYTIKAFAEDSEEPAFSYSNIASEELRQLIIELVSEGLRVTHEETTS